MREYLPLTRDDRNRLIGEGTGFVGARLDSVRYHYLPHVDEAEYAGGENGFDDDLVAVELSFGESGRKTLTWATLGVHEGLSLLEDSDYDGVSVGTVDVTSRAGWREHVGLRIDSVAASWHVSDESYPESIWSLRLGFAESSVVIALGGLNPELDYIPDELVVIFAEDLARRFRPPYVKASSWGEPIDPSER